jgi:hypothetical protein
MADRARRGPTAARTSVNTRSVLKQAAFVENKLPISGFHRN